jgi:hypothetical protein
MHTFACTKVADTAFVRTKVADNTFVYKKVERAPLTPGGHAARSFAEDGDTTFADIYDSLVAIIVHTAARTSTTRFAPPGGRQCGRQQGPVRDLAPQRLQHGTTSDCIKVSGSTFACAKVAGSTV